MTAGSSEAPDGPGSASAAQALAGIWIFSRLDWEELELLALEDERIAVILDQIQAAVDNQAAQVASARQQLDAARAEVAARERAALSVLKSFIPRTWLPWRRQLPVHLKVGSRSSQNACSAASRVPATARPLASAAAAPTWRPRKGPLRW